VLTGMGITRLTFLWRYSELGAFWSSRMFNLLSRERVCMLRGFCAFHKMLHDFVVEMDFVSLYLFPIFLLPDVGPSFCHVPGRCCATNALHATIDNLYLAFWHTTYTTNHMQNEHRTPSPPTCSPTHIWNDMRTHISYTWCGNPIRFAARHIPNKYGKGQSCEREPNQEHFDATSAHLSRCLMYKLNSNYNYYIPRREAVRPPQNSMHLGRRNVRPFNKIKGDPPQENAREKTFALELSVSCSPNAKHDGPPLAPNKVSADAVSADAMQ
jgi:hypothetical protein